MNRRRPSIATRSLPFTLVLAVLLALVVVGGAALWLNRTPVPVGPLVGTDIGGPFTLIDQDGRTVTDKTYDGRSRLVYFGYTYCPDVCPLDMQKLGKGLQLFRKADPARAARVVALFITVDPARDTPAVLKTFVRAFDPQLIGLTGSEAQVAAVEKSFHVYARRAGPATDKDYLVDHSAVLYLMGPDNKPISFLSHDATPEAISAELAKYVQ